ncbi:MAG: SemiSWEET family sugar transporter [Vulcanimicrobiaceae bacterium]
MMETLLGILATALVVITGLPQLISAIRSHSLAGISIWTFAMYAVSGVVWIAYGILRHDAAIYVTNAFVVLNGAAICVTVHLRRRAERGE